MPHAAREKIWDEYVAGYRAFIFTAALDDRTKYCTENTCSMGLQIPGYTSTRPLFPLTLAIPSLICVFSMSSSFFVFVFHTYQFNKVQHVLLFKGNY